MQFTGTGCYSDTFAVHGDWGNVDAWWEAAVLRPAYSLWRAVRGGWRLFARGYHCSKQPALA